MRDHKVYTAEERAALLAMFVASDMTMRAYARSKKLPLSTLRDWINGDTDVDRAIRAQQETRLAALYDDEIRGALQVAATKRDQASYRDLLVGVGILDDKLTRSMGEPTERVEHIVVELDLSHAD